MAKYIFANWQERQFNEFWKQEEVTKLALAAAEPEGQSAAVPREEERPRSLDSPAD